MADLSDIIDMERYPVDDLSSDKGRTVVSACRGQMAATGLCLLPGFVRDEAVMEMQKSAASLMPKAHYTEHWRATPNGDETCPDSLLTQETRASMRSIAFDYLADDAPLRRLYLWDGFTAFINAVFDGPRLYITDDPLVSCMMTVLEEGDELGWHYDPNDIVISLSVQAPVDGGEFEFAPRVRFPAANAFDNEKAILAGVFPGVISKRLPAGTLSLFNGHKSLHRVAPVVGERQRVIALFNYSEVPNYMFSAGIQSRFFGRVAQETRQSNRI